MAKNDEIWTKLDDRSSLVSKDTQYRNMQAWQRRCALCDVEFIAYNPARSPADKPPTVTTCEEHRGAPNGITYGWLAWSGKDVVPGKRMKIGAAGGAVSSDDAEEVARLKKELAEAYDANAEISRDFGGLRKFANEAFGLSLIGPAINYASVTAAYAKVFNQIDVLKGKMAPYDLQTNMQQSKPAFDPHAALAKELGAKNNSEIFPWGVDSP